jgi:hypothetical protein
MAVTRTAHITFAVLGCVLLVGLGVLAAVWFVVSEWVPVF